MLNILWKSTHEFAVWQKPAATLLTPTVNASAANVLSVIQCDARLKNSVRHVTLTCDMSENGVLQVQRGIFLSLSFCEQPASVAQWAESQCAPTGTACRRSRGSIPGRPVDFVFGFQRRMV